jgi:transcriptional antiterminator NusG
MSAEEHTLESAQDAIGDSIAAALPVSAREDASSPDDQAQGPQPEAEGETISSGDMTLDGSEAAEGKGEDAPADEVSELAPALEGEAAPGGEEAELLTEGEAAPGGEEAEPLAEGEAAPGGEEAEPLAEGEAAPGGEEAEPLAEDSAPGAEAAPEGEAAAEPTGPLPQWYVVHGYSGYENRVKKNLEQRIESMGMHDKIFQVIVPTEEEIEIRGGERRVVERRVFPGYILVEMIMDETSWYVVRNTPGVTGFVGSGNRPAPLSAEEVDKIMRRIEAAEPTIKVSFKVGQKVRLIDGAFVDFVGQVDELYPEKGRARVLVSMFGRDTPLEIDLLYLERV